ncbi:MAG: hypothetical protein ACOX1L_07250 [Erysipelotrichaceae bacterium]|jgi:hypothetical protein
MAIYDFLNSYGQFDSLASFNGLLEDYLKIYPEEKNREVFEKMLLENKELSVYTNYGLKFNLALITNKKIGYKDAGKINDNTLKVPYIIYWKQKDNQRALIINQNNYIEAKGMFFSLTETDNYFEDHKDDLISIHLTDESSDEVIDIFKNMSAKKDSLLTIQKNLDSKYISDVDLMKEQCVKICQNIFDETIKIISPLSKDDRKAYIDEAVARVFVVKKALYVRYMSNKHLLIERHFSNPSQQRAFAKSYVNELPIIPYFKLFNM